MVKGKKGWHGEPQRHALAAKGIKTGSRVYKSPTIKYPAKTTQERLKEDTAHDSLQKIINACIVDEKDEKNEYFVQLLIHPGKDSSELDILAKEAIKRKRKHNSEQLKDASNFVMYDVELNGVSGYLIHSRIYSSEPGHEPSPDDFEPIVEFAKAIKKQDNDYNVIVNRKNNEIFVGYFDNRTGAEPNKRPVKRGPKPKHNTNIAIIEGDTNWPRINYYEYIRLENPKYIP